MSHAPVRCSLPLLVVALCVAPLSAETLKVPQAFDTIQEAVNAASSGDVVLVSKGVYLEHVTIGTSGIALRGKSGATIDGTYTGTCVLVNADDVEVSGLTLVHGGIGQAPDGVIDFGGVEVNGSGALISKLTIRGCDAFGVFLKGTGTIRNCNIELSNGFGIAVITPDPAVTEVTFITKNEVSLCRAGGITCLFGPLDIQKNTCDRNGQWGINVEVKPGDTDGEQITPTVVSRNTCTANRDIEGQGIGYGLVLIDSIGTSMLAEKNTLTGNAIGMGIEGSSFRASSNKIEGNHTVGLIVQASDCDISENSIRDNGNSGLFVGIGPDDLDEDAHNEIRDNVLQHNGGDGIHIASSSNSIHDNTCKDNLGDGLQLGPEHTGIEVSGNTCVGNAHDGLDNWSQLTLFTDNVCKKNGGADLAGAGNGLGTADPASTNNEAADGTGLLTPQELDLELDVP